MTLQQRKAEKFKDALAIFDYFKKDLEQYIKDGDITEAEAQILLEDKAEQLGL